MCHRPPCKKCVAAEDEGTRFILRADRHRRQERNENDKKPCHCSLSNSNAIRIPALQDAALRQINGSGSRRVCYADSRNYPTRGIVFAAGLLNFKVMTILQCGCLVEGYRLAPEEKLAKSCLPAMDLSQFRSSQLPSAFFAQTRVNAYHEDAPKT